MKITNRNVGILTDEVIAELFLEIAKAMIQVKEEGIHDYLLYRRIRNVIDECEEGHFSDLSLINEDIVSDYDGSM